MTEAAHPRTQNPAASVTITSEQRLAAWEELMLIAAYNEISIKTLETCRILFWETAR